MNIDSNDPSPERTKLGNERKNAKIIQNVYKNVYGLSKASNVI